MSNENTNPSVFKMENFTFQPDDGKKKTKKRRYITAEQKLNIISILEGTPTYSMRRIAREFGVEESSVREIKKNKESLKFCFNKMSSARLKTAKKRATTKYPQLEDAIFDWLCKTRDSGVPVTSTMLQSQALIIATHFGIDEKDFKASKGWLHNFKKRWELGNSPFVNQPASLEKSGPVGVATKSAPTSAKSNKKAKSSPAAQAAAPSAIWLVFAEEEKGASGYNAYHNYGYGSHNATLVGVYSVEGEAQRHADSLRKDRNDEINGYNPEMNSRRSVRVVRAPVSYKFDENNPGNIWNFAADTNLACR